VLRQAPGQAQGQLPARASPQQRVGVLQPQEPQRVSGVRQAARQQAAQASEAEELERQAQAE